MARKLDGSIHDAIDAINNESVVRLAKQDEKIVQNITRQDLLENKYDEQIKNIAASEPQNAEIVDARLGFDTLGIVIKQKVYHFENVEKMKNCLTLLPGDVCETLGYYEANDGGGATYNIRLKSEDDIEDSGCIHFIQNSLVAELVVINDSINIKQFGAIDDGQTNNDIAIQNAVDSNIKNIIIPNGNYFFANVTIKKDCNISGLGTLYNGYFGIANNIKVKFSNLTFKDLESRAFYINNSKVTIDNCYFDNITLNKENLSAYGCIYANGTGFDLVVKDSTIVNNHGYGAIYTVGGGNIYIDNNHIDSPDYRGIHCSGADSTLKGIISNNLIEECGKNNTADSGAVGCNGIYAPAAYLVDVISNKIINVRENAIEGNFKSIQSNYIDGTNVEIETKTTPSIEGIFVSNIDTPCLIRGNYMKNILRRGISSIQISEENSKKLIIEDNYIEMSEYNGSLGNSIILQGSKVNNKTVANNQVNAPIIFTSYGNNNIFVGNISDLSPESYLSAGTINNNIQLYNHDFRSLDNLSGITYTNCTPSIVTNDNITAIHIDYQLYNKLLTPKISNRFGKNFIKLNLHCRGNFEIKLYNGDTYKKTILTVNSDEYKHYELNIKCITMDITDKYHFRFLALPDKYTEIANINYSVLSE